MSTDNDSTRKIESTAKDDAASQQGKTQIEQWLSRYGESVKHAWQILRVVGLVGGVLIYLCREFIFPNWDWAVPSVLMAFGAASVIVHRKWYPLFFVKGAVTTFSILAVASLIFTMFYCTEVSLVEKGSPVPQETFLRLSLWLVLFIECLCLIVTAIVEHIKLHMLVMQLPATFLTAMLPQFRNVIYVLIARLTRAQLAAGIKPDPAPLSDEYLRELFAEAASRFPREDPPVMPTMFDGYGWWDRQIKKSSDSSAAPAA